MHTFNMRSALVVLLLIAGLLFVYSPQLYSLAAPSVRPAAESPHYGYVADLDFWQRTPREAEVVATARFDLNVDLNNVPMQLGDWSGQDAPETNQEVMILLEPEQYVQRLYHNQAGQYLWLSMVGGRSSQPFHAPDICYDADGWQYNLGSHAIGLEDGGELYGLWLEAQKEMPDRAAPAEHIVFYFYLFPDSSRRLSDGIVLFKLTSPRYGSTEETLALQADFVRQLFVQAY